MKEKGSLNWLPFFIFSLSASSFSLTDRPDITRGQAQILPLQFFIYILSSVSSKRSDAAFQFSGNLG